MVIMTNTISSLIILSFLLVNLLYTAFIIGFPMFNNKVDKVRDVINEFFIISMLYVVLVLVEQYLTDPKMRLYLGYSTVIMIATLFLFNLIPICIGMAIQSKNAIKSKYHERK